MNYYIRSFAGKKVRIDFERGLGQFLENYGVLPNRILCENGNFNIQPGVTYRRYKFHPESFRFEYDMEFDYTNARVDNKRKMLIYTRPDGEEVEYQFVWLGLTPPEEACLNVILSGKSWQDLEEGAS